MMKKALAILLLTLGPSNAICNDAAPFAFREEYHLNHGDISGHASLNVTPREVRTGESFTIDLRYTNTGAGHSFFNPFLVSHFPLPAAIAVYDAEKRYLGDYLQFTAGSRNAGGAGSQIFIWDGYVGARRELRAGALPGSQGTLPDKPLPPGKYHLQAIYYKGFVTFNPKAAGKLTLDELAHFYDDFDRSELFRSNVIEIELLPANDGPSR